MDAKTFVRTVPLLFTFIAGLASHAAGQHVQQTAVPRHLGEVEVLSGPVPCADGQCYNLRVTCPEVAAAAEARLKVVAPKTPSPRGTILFTTGSQGTFLYETPPESRRTLAELSAAGFRTVQLEWLD